MSIVNNSFIKMAQVLKDMHVIHNDFFLKTINEGVDILDPFNPSLSDEEKALVIKECKENIWYFLREIARIPEEPRPLSGHPKKSALSWDKDMVSCAKYIPHESPVVMKDTIDISTVLKLQKVNIMLDPNRYADKIITVKIYAPDYMQIWAHFSSEPDRFYNIQEWGFVGPPTGYPGSAAGQTPVYIVVPHPGIYNIKIEIIDVSNNELLESQNVQLYALYDHDEIPCKPVEFKLSMPTLAQAWCSSNHISNYNIHTGSMQINNTISLVLLWELLFHGTYCTDMIISNMYRPRYVSTITRIRYLYNMLPSYIKDLVSVVDESTISNTMTNSDIRESVYPVSKANIGNLIEEFQDNIVFMDDFEYLPVNIELVGNIPPRSEYYYIILSPDGQKNSESYRKAALFKDLSARWNPYLFDLDIEAVWDFITHSSLNNMMYIDCRNLKSEKEHDWFKWVCEQSSRDKDLIHDITLHRT